MHQERKPATLPGADGRLGLLPPGPSPAPALSWMLVVPLSHEPCLWRRAQIEGLNWMLNLASRRLNGILADEMGLGKTLQARRSGHPNRSHRPLTRRKV